MNDTQSKIGKLLTEPEQRDAIHIAVFPVEAAAKLYPGQRVNLIGGKASPAIDGVGIVDPFLPRALAEGDRFWLFLHPNTITDMRHHWVHPAFERGPDVLVLEPAKISREAHITKSRAWIAEHADALGLSADVLMADAASYLEETWCKVQQGSERWRDTFDATEFWHHYEVVTGTVVERDKKQNIYCCAC